MAGIHFGNFRVKQHVAAGLLQLYYVLLYRPRVPFQVGRVVKLGGVNKNAAYGNIRPLLSCLYKGNMALMQRAHGGYKPYCMAFLTQSLQVLLQFAF